MYRNSRADPEVLQRLPVVRDLIIQLHCMNLLSFNFSRSGRGIRRYLPVSLHKNTGNIQVDLHGRGQVRNKSKL